MWPLLPVCRLQLQVLRPDRATRMIALEAAFALSLSPQRTKCSGWWLRFKDGEADVIAGAEIGLSEATLMSDVKF